MHRNSGSALLSALLLPGLIALVGPASADQEAGNRPSVIASEYGNCYARTLPSARYGNDGTTFVYRTEAPSDVLVAKFNWYSSQLRLECNIPNKRFDLGVSIVEFGPWPRGQSATTADLALAFYWNATLLRRYSTLDIAGTAENVVMSTSHYTVIDKVLGYERVTETSRVLFRVHTIDGRMIAFDAGTGAIVSTVRDAR